jgi:hypothetical protein
MLPQPPAGTVPSAIWQFCRVKVIAPSQVDFAAPHEQPEQARVSLKPSDTTCGVPK